VSGVFAEVGSTANNYQILARLATGGMAEIFLARSVSGTGVERYCVLKRILRNRAADVELVTMFLDEARLAAHLQHPNVAQVYDIGKLGESYFFTMEYVHGETVRALLQRARSLRRELPIASVLTVIAGAAAGLHHAHERIGMDGRPLDIVHRDVSPSNLMVSYEGSVKVVDFGVAKAADRASETRSGTVKGKISYLSPEQCRGLPIDRRSDLFSLGIVMWEMLTTERLFRRNSDFENMTAIVNDPVPLPSSRRASLPHELDAITMRLLAKDPSARYQDADELVEALEGAAARTASMISPSALGRLLREMFGQRPEPWLELDTQEEVPEGVTVTSEPIPAQLIGSAISDLDLQLAQVPDLGGAGGARPVVAERAPRDSGPRVAVPTPPTQLMIAPMAPEAAPTAAFPTQLPLGEIKSTAAVSPVDGRADTVADLPPTLAFARPEAPPRPPSVTPTMIGTAPSGPRMTPDSGPRAAPALVAPHDSLARVEAANRPRTAWQLAIVIGLAVVIGSLTVVAVIRSGDDYVPEAVLVPTDAAARVAITPIEPIDAAELAPVAPPEAAVAAIADAALAPTISIDAAEEVTLDETITIDEPDPETADEPDPETADEPDRVTRRDRGPRRRRRSDLEAAMDDGRYAEVVARCMKNLPGDKTLVTCTLAACRVKNEAKARAWYQRLSAKHKRSAASSCKGVELVPKRTSPDAGVDPCVADPMACQH
jgi:serine/threonine protein kinase